MNTVYVRTTFSRIFKRKEGQILLHQGKNIPSNLRLEQLRVRELRYVCGQVRTEFMNKSREFYNENEDIAVMMFDINYGYKRYTDIRADLYIDPLSTNITQSI